MRHFLRATALVFSLAFLQPAFAEDAKPVVAADPARIAAARDLMEVTGVTKQLDGMMDAMKEGFSRGAKADESKAGKEMSSSFNDAMAKLMAYKGDMMTDFAQLYAESFTAEEMKTIADFYRSGTGAKFISMMPDLMKKGSEIGMKYSQKAISGIDAPSAGGAAPK